jgi:hypothetical protein
VLQVSWCKLEVQVQNPKDVAVATDETRPPPPLVAMSIALKTVLNDEARANEIVAVSATVHGAGNTHPDRRCHLAPTEMLLALGGQ